MLNRGIAQFFRHGGDAFGSVGKQDVADTQMPEIVEIAKRHNVHPALVCLKWAVQRGQVPIPFSVKEPQYISNLKCVTEDPLTEEEMETIRLADKNCRLVKGQVFLWPGAKSWEDLWDVSSGLNVKAEGVKTDKPLVFKIKLV